MKPITEDLQNFGRIWCLTNQPHCCRRPFNGSCGSWLSTLVLIIVPRHNGLRQASESTVWLFVSPIQQKCVIDGPQRRRLPFAQIFENAAMTFAVVSFNKNLENNPWKKDTQRRNQFIAVARPHVAVSDGIAQTFTE